MKRPLVQYRADIKIILASQIPSRHGMTDCDHRLECRAALAGCPHALAGTAGGSVVRGCCCHRGPRPGFRCSTSWTANCSSTTFHEFAMEREALRRVCERDGTEREGGEKMLRRECRRLGVFGLMMKVLCALLLPLSSSNITPSLAPEFFRSLLNSGLSSRFWPPSSARPGPPKGSSQPAVGRVPPANPLQLTLSQAEPSVEASQWSVQSGQHSARHRTLNFGIENSRLFKIRANGSWT
jgi:hypothetical protein